MSSIMLSLIVLACVFGGALLGMVLRRWVPRHHLAADSKDVVKQGIGLIGTMAALLLSLLVASAKSSYDTQKGEVADMSAKVVLFDHLLAQYGPETQEIRDQLRGVIERTVDRMWHESDPGASRDPTAVGSDAVYIRILALTPKNDAQRTLLGQISTTALDVGKTRWLVYEQGGSSISMPMLVMMVCWLSVVFIGFGLFALVNSTVIVTLFLCAVAVSGAIFLILEMDRPFDGIIQISNAPLCSALEHIGRSPTTTVTAPGI